jgi:hypothetical protein
MLGGQRLEDIVEGCPRVGRRAPTPIAYFGHYPMEERTK